MTGPDKNQKRRLREAITGQINHFSCQQWSHPTYLSCRNVFALVDGTGMPSAQEVANVIHGFPVDAQL